MKMTYWIAGVLVVGIGVGAASAHQGGQGPRGIGKMTFEAFDTDGDGKVTLAEMDALKQARFTAADTDGDGMLSSEEMIARGMSRAGERMAKRMEKRIGHMIEKRDATGDGMLSFDEMGQNQEGNRLFERMDANSDGAVTAEEFAQAKTKWRAGHGGAADSE